MDHTYEVAFEKGQYSCPYTVRVETTNYECYRELKEFIHETILKYENMESKEEKTNNKT